MGSDSEQERKRQALRDRLTVRPREVTEERADEIATRVVRQDREKHRAQKEDGGRQTER